MSETTKSLTDKLSGQEKSFTDKISSCQKTLTDKISAQEKCVKEVTDKIGADIHSMRPFQNPLSSSEKLDSSSKADSSSSSKLVTLTKAIDSIQENSKSLENMGEPELSIPLYFPLLFSKGDEDRVCHSKRLGEIEVSELCKIRPCNFRLGLEVIFWPS